MCQSMERGLISTRCALRAISRSKPGISWSIACVPNEQHSHITMNVSWAVLDGTGPN